MQYGFSTFPGGLGKEFEVLDGDVCSLCQHWSCLTELFHNDERIDLLSESEVEGFFGEFKAVWTEYIVVQVFRIADENVKGGRLSITTVFEALRKANHSSVAVLQPLYNAVSEKCHALITVRHNVLAHTNRQIATGRAKLDDLLNREIREAVEAIVAFMDACWKSVLNQDPEYHHQTMTEDVNALLMCLARGAEYRQLELADPAVTPTHGRRLREQGRFASLVSRISRRNYSNATRL